MENRILFASRTAFDNGILNGKWVDLTDAKALKKIDEFKNAREGHEFFIAYSKASVYMDISEYDDPYKLVDFVKRLKDLDETQLEAYEAMLIKLGLDREEALDKAENWEFDAIEWNDGSIEEAVGRYYAELSGWLDYDEKIRSYFDYEKYGHDIYIESFVCDNGQTIFVLH